MGATWSDRRTDNVTVGPWETAGRERKAQAMFSHICALPETELWWLAAHHELGDPYLAFAVQLEADPKLGQLIARSAKVNRPSPLTVARLCEMLRDHAARRKQHPDDPFDGLT